MQVLNSFSVMLETLAIFLCINFMYSRKIILNVYDGLFAGLQLLTLEVANYFMVNKQIILLCYLLIFLFQLLKFKLSLEQISVMTIFACVCISCCAIDKFCTNAYFLAIYTYRFFGVGK